MLHHIKEPPVSEGEYMYKQVCENESNGLLSTRVIQAAVLYDQVPVEDLRNKLPYEKSAPRMDKFGTKAVIEHNCRMFNEILQDDLLLPYRAIVDGMQATTTIKKTIHSIREKTLPNGRTIEIAVTNTEYVEVPDHPTRRAAARAYFLLTGQDPSLTKKFEIKAVNNDGVDIHSIYLQIINTPEGNQEEMYNRAVKDGKNALMLPDYVPSPMESGH